MNRSVRVSRCGAQAAHGPLPPFPRCPPSVSSLLPPVHHVHLCEGSPHYRDGSRDKVAASRLRETEKQRERERQRETDRDKDREIEKERQRQKQR